MKREFVTPWNFKYNKKKHAETNLEPSMTVPDMSYTLEELLEKFTHGIDPAINRPGQYIDDDDLDDDTLDMSDPLTAQDEATDQLFNIKGKVEYAKKLKAEKDAIEKQKPIE